VAKGNDGNYFQHSVEVAVALHLIKLSAQGVLHVALTHGMAPFEPCDTPSNGQSKRRLHEALGDAQKPPRSGESQIVSAYRRTKAKLEHYPNTGELLAEMAGRDRLSGGITERDGEKHEKLVETWSGSGVMPVKSSWRSEVGHGGLLSCPAALRAPWLFAADPMTFREDGYADDDKLYQEDISRLSAALKGFVASGEPGAALLFVYAVRPKVRPQFWTFADSLSDNSGIPAVSCWMPHQGGNRNLAAVLCSGFVLPERWLPDGIHAGR
jgi:hypothetical protein